MRSAELVRVAQPIACCGEVGGVSRRGEIAQRGVWTPVVVIIGPIGDAGSGVIEAEEQGFIEKLVPHPAIEALTEAVLHRLARRDEVPGNAVFLRPGQHGVRRELGAIRSYWIEAGKLPVDGPGWSASITLVQTRC